LNSVHVIPEGPESAFVAMLLSTHHPLISPVIEFGYSHLEEEEKEMASCFIIKKPWHILFFLLC